MLKELLFHFFKSEQGFAGLECNSDLLTINTDVLGPLQCPLSPEAPSVELPPQPVTVNSSITPVKELHDASNSAVCTQDLAIQEDQCKCTIKLPPDFFTLDELAVSNTEGNFGKQPLDKTKLPTLKSTYINKECGTYIEKKLVFMLISLFLYSLSASPHNVSCQT